MRVLLENPGIARMTSSAPDRLMAPLTSNAPGRNPRVGVGEVTGLVCR
jgi:hypothetical protein